MLLLLKSFLLGTENGIIILIVFERLMVLFSNNSPDFVTGSMTAQKCNYVDYPWLYNSWS